ncbi:MAG TPA: TonB-dependent receptor [Pseudomonadales bacterium]|nr:TonB-dependent receptor [Pseudomonadales bacterium]
MKKSKLATAIKFAMGASAALSVLPVAHAIADENSLEEVVVTGSRIKTDGFESASPVTVSTALEIKATGINKIEDFLNSLPQLEAGDNSYISNGASGNATLDLRGMGANRTLVLINGRRMSPGGAFSSAAADVNQIPTSMIERVEVLTGGASTVYGADAVAGVVNFVLREDFEGVEINLGTSGYMHDNDNAYIQGLMDARGFDYPKGSNGVDGEADTIDIIIGSNFADGKGNATMYATWRKGSELRQEARDYSSCALSGAGTSCGGSSTTPIPNFFLAPIVNGVYDPAGEEGWYALQSDSSFKLRNGEVYNYAPINHFMRPDEKWTFGGNIKYALNDNTRIYGEFSYMDYRTAAQIAESGTFYAELYEIPLSSTLFSDAQRQQLLSLFSAPGFDANGSIGAYIGKRNVEGGPRSNILENNSFRMVLGVEGTMADGWDYDVNYQKGRVNSYSTYINDFFAPKISAALENGEYNVFTYQGVTSEQADALTGVAILGAGVSQEIFSGFISGDTGYSLGTTDRTISLAAGMERREIKFDRNADSVYEDGSLLGQGGPTPSIAGGYDVTDLFFEMAVPVLDNLTTELGFRTSDYSLAGNHNTYKVALSYEPADWFRVRTGYNRAVRSPSVIEMFAPANLGLWNGVDGCAGATPVFTAEQCARTGVTAAQYGNIDPSPASQYNGIFGGNTALAPEVADTYTFGIVVDPIENLTFSVDYWRIDLSDAIGSVGAETILEQCAVNNNPTFCGLINRGTAGSLWRGTTGYITSTNQNLGEENLEGVDLAAAYSMELAGGVMSFKMSASHMLKKETLSLPGDESTRKDCVGLISTSCFPSPEWRSNLSANYSKDDWSVGAKWRFFDGVTYDGATDKIAAANMGKSQSYIDLNAAYTVNENIEVSGTMRNVLDKEPPMVGSTLSSNANTIAGFYDTLGRYVSANVTFTF